MKRLDEDIEETMKRLDKDIEHTIDCQRIQRALQLFNYDPTLAECFEFWSVLSRDNYCAGWMRLPADHLLMRAVKTEIERLSL